MVINNYDKSSTGINIEANICWNNDVAQDNWNNNFIKLKSGPYKNYYLYTDWDNVSAYYNDKYPNNSGIEHIMDIEECYNIAETKRNLTILRYLTVKEYGLLCYSEAKVNYRAIDLVELLFDTDCVDNIDDLDIEYTSKVDILETIGYSQGDYENVLIATDVLKQIWGNEPNINDLQEEINHLFWDQPLYCVVTINGEEYDYAVQNGTYSYDKDTLIDELCNAIEDVDTDVLRTELENILPEEPDYE